MATFKKLLVPVDGSAPSDAAVSLAARIARDQRAEIVFLHVSDVAKIVAMTAAPGMSPGIDPSFVITAERESGDRALRDAFDSARSSSIVAKLLTKEGPCVDTILDTARRYDVDLIVIGSHGRGGIARAFMGSVAEGVLRRSDVPVLVTRTLTKVKNTVKDAAADVPGLPREIDPVC